MSIKLPINPTFKTICMIGKDEARSLLNIFDCMMDNEDGYSDLEAILDYRLDNLLANIDQVKQELESYVSKKKEQLFRARLDVMAEEKIRLAKAMRLDWGRDNVRNN